jgi:hypothetical protein
LPMWCSIDRRESRTSEPQAVDRYPITNNTADRSRRPLPNLKRRACAPDSDFGVTRNFRPLLLAADSFARQPRPGLTLAHSNDVRVRCGRLVGRPRHINELRLTCRSEPLVCRAFRSGCRCW